MLADIETGAPKVAAAVALIAGVRPDVLLLTGFDWDHDGMALAAFAAALKAAGLAYPHRYAPRPNAGMQSGLDLDGNGRTGEPRDAQGYGRFTGQGGMALLSRLQLRAEAARDFSAVLWADLPGNLIDGAGLSPGARAVQRLSSTGHWDVPLVLPSGRDLHLLAFAATPPLFDGPEDRNGRRNRDETAFWLRYLDGALPVPPPLAPFAILGDADIDPVAGEGRRDALVALLADPRLQDLRPAGAKGTATALYGAPLRLDYILPSADLTVTGAGVIWPETGETPPRRALVWVDISLP
ncbi:endonuclease/exonuclease/phosphatase family protein [Paenirhodobacter ferrireducens]|uniref:endonuclease/exonuclease/phosphatase family protein n=1 Tax=Paenirhodobacter ferrireducens TaxID=1215032 RepID=UPI001F0CB497|nr:endonuclease/exonuclease/phosphatase family protein [Sinirhodobacter ferrireducens]